MAPDWIEMEYYKGIGQLAKEKPREPIPPTLEQIKEEVDEQSRLP
jgi:hypothetical protein